MELDNVIRRIQKCLALGASSNEHEAAAAMRQAQKLMEAYNVSPEHVGQVVIELHRATSTACTKPPAWEYWLANGIASAFGCQTLIHRGWFDNLHNKNGSMAQYSFVGPRHQSLNSAWAMEMLIKQIVKGKAEHTKALKGLSRKAIIESGNAYAQAFVLALRDKIEAFAGNDEATKKAIQDVMDKELGMSDELRAKYNAEYDALSEKEKEALRKRAPKGPKVARGSYHDRAAGMAAGQKASLYRPIGG